jgi:protein subunit release factor B
MFGRTIQLLKVNIPNGRIEKLFSRGSGSGGQNLHASNSRCMLKFDINKADWIHLKVKNVFIELYGSSAISPKGTVVIVREDTRSAADNEKLALRQLQSMLDKAEELSLMERETVDYATEIERIKSGKTDAQIRRYKDRVITEKKMRSSVKKNRINRDDLWN